MNQKEKTENYGLKSTLYLTLKLLSDGLGWKYNKQLIGLKDLLGLNTAE